MKFCYLDMEYRNSNSRDLGLVMVSFNDGTKTRSIWLDEAGKIEAKKTFGAMEDYTMVCFNAGAEARGFVALGLNPMKYQWIDLYLDYKQLMNKDNRYAYGWHLGKTKLGRPMLKESIPMHRPNGHFSAFEIERMAEDHKAKMHAIGKSVEPVTASLINASINFVDGYKKIAVDSKIEKDEMIAIIINPDTVTFDNDIKNRIIKYCESDIGDLREMLINMGKALCEQSHTDVHEVLKNRLWRGTVGAMMAIIESNGTPINMEIFNALRDNADKITNTAKTSFNMETGYEMYQWKGTGVRANNFHFDTFSEKQDVFDKFLEDQNWTHGWLKTKDGKYSKSEDALKNKSLHPVVESLLKTRKVSKAMSSVKGSGNKKVVPTYKRIGEDNHLRVPLFPYGTQTGRNAAPAGSYIYAQGGWMKCVIDIPKGYRVVETDFSSQEFIIGAVLSGDENMLEAYKTDVYISFGFAAQQFDPKYKNVHEIIAVKSSDKEVKRIRQKMKGIVLSLSYGARPPSIASSTGLPLMEVEALVAKYERHYSVYYEWRDKILRQHTARETPLTLEHTGWYLGPDNFNSLSAMNFPVQATGSSTLHKSLYNVLMDDELLENGVKIINPLHDAIYYLVPESYADAEARIEKHMYDASREILGCDGMKLETDVWHHGDNLANGYPLWEQFRELLKNK